MRTALLRVVELRERRRHQEAVDLLSTVDGERPDVAYQLAWLLDCMGRDDEAIRSYRRALRRNASAAARGDSHRKSTTGPFLGLAAVLLRTGRADLAVDVLVSASSHFPQSDQVRALEAVARIKLHAVRPDRSLGRGHSPSDLRPWGRSPAPCRPRPPFAGGEVASTGR